MQDEEILQLNEEIIKGAAQEESGFEPEQLSFFQDEEFNMQNFEKSEISELSQLMPNIKLSGVGDILQQENGQKVVELWAKGASLAQAYAAVNYQSLLKQNTHMATQQAINSLNSKAHLKVSENAPSNEVYVPQQVMEIYKAMLPKWSDKQIRKHYKQSKGE